MNYNITKCICYDTTFEEMKNIMRENNLLTLEELIKVKTVASNADGIRFNRFHRFIKRT